jgi:NitT/TauT family transport system ATP-binding protein
MKKNAVISVRELNKAFYINNIRLDVVKDVSFDVCEGETVAVIGPSGCGKTTLLRIICAFEAYDSGSVIVDGLIHNKPNKNVLMLFQDFNQLMPWRTVLGNITYSLTASGTVKNYSEAEARAMKRIEDVALSGFERSYPHQLSGGMKQRVAIARALAFQPRVLLMDEPFAALDNITRGALQIMTRGVCEKNNISVLLVTHSVEEAVIMADRIIIMQKKPGRIKKIVENYDKNNLTPQKRATLADEILSVLNITESEDV